MKSFSQSNDIEMHSMHSEGKSIIAERFIRTLNNKNYKYLTSVSKNVFIDNFNHTVINAVIHIMAELK